jgi:hypothetical protein
MAVRNYIEAAANAANQELGYQPNRRGPITVKLGGLGIDISGTAANSRGNVIFATRTPKMRGCPSRPTQDITTVVPGQLSLAGFALITVGRF